MSVLSGALKIISNALCNDDSGSPVMLEWGWLGKKSFWALSNNLHFMFITELSKQTNEWIKSKSDDEGVIQTATKRSILHQHGVEIGKITRVTVLDQ